MNVKVDLLNFAKEFVFERILEKRNTFFLSKESEKNFWRMSQNRERFLNDNELSQASLVERSISLTRTVNLWPNG